MSSPTTTKAWKQQLLQARSHYAKLSASLWRLTRCLVKIFDDAEFRAETECRDDLHAADWIDAEFPELPFRFLELRAILAEFPQEKQWRDSKLSVLADAIPVLDGEKQERKKPRRVTLKEFEEMKQERDHYKLRCQSLDEQVGELRGRVKEIEEANQRLLGRLEEAEKLAAA